MKRWTEEVFGFVVVVVGGAGMINWCFVSKDSVGPLWYFGIMGPLWLLLLIADIRRRYRHVNRLINKTRPIPKAGRYGQIRIEMSSKKGK